MQRMANGGGGLYNRAMLVIPFPAIDPVLVTIGPFAIRWYALAYIVGIVAGWRIILHLAANPGSGVSREQADDMLLWATGGIILGGRLGYVLFYKPAYFFANPLEIPVLWSGGMSFHGGIIGVAIAILWFCRRRNVNVFAMSDLISSVAPIGLGLGRIANFINGELWGRPTDVAWAMVFPHDPAQLPRHPSQLYQAAMEGLLLLALVWTLRLYAPAARSRGFVTGAFVAGYAVARIVGEFFREPDAHLGFLFAGATMGQLLSLPMLAFGLGLMLYARRRDATRATH